jgi:vitamin B12 transporter
MNLLKLLLLASSFLSAFSSFSSVARAELSGQSVEEMRSQVSQRSADLLPSNSDSSYQSNKQLTAHGDNAHSDDDKDEIEIQVTGKRSPFTPSSAPTYIVPKSEIEQQNPSNANDCFSHIFNFYLSLRQMCYFCVPIPSQRCLSLSLTLML